MLLWILLGGGFLFVAGYILGLILERRAWQDMADAWAERVAEEADTSLSQPINNRKNSSQEVNK